jgi:hypothetical protein
MKALLSLVSGVGVLLAGVAVAPAAPIIDTNVVSTDSRQSITGTQLEITTNLPNSSWQWGAGWSWGSPFIPATWDPPGIPANIISLSEENTAVGLSIASTGGYTKPTQMTLSADLVMLGNMNNNIGLGFWGTFPATNAGTSSTSFTGIMLNEVNGTLQVFENGSAAGSAVSIGSVVENTFYSLSYDVNTTTGALSNVRFEGVAKAGLSSAAFTNAATAVAGVMDQNGSRGGFKSFSVDAVPEPASLGLLCLAAGGLFTRRQRQD